MSLQSDTGDAKAQHSARAARRGFTLLAHYEGAERQPAMRTRTWYRLYALGWWRGAWTDECARRMARHLTHWANERGRLVDVQTIMELYARVHGVSERTAWTDFRRLRLVGLVRQVAGAAPGRPARYVLSVPTDLPAALPRSLARAVRDEIDPIADRVRGRQTRVTVEASLSRCEVVRYGPLTAPPLHTQSGCGRLQTSPYTQEGNPPSPGKPGRSGRTRRRWQRFGGISDDEQADALYVVKRCGSQWRRQRGAGGALTAEQLATVVPLVALLLRHVESVDVVELLTEHVRSAVDLAAVLRSRLWRQLAAVRRRAQVRADEDGGGYAAAMAARAEAAEERYQRTQSGRAALAAARAELAERQMRRHLGAQAERARPSSRLDDRVERVADGAGPGVRHADHSGVPGAATA